ncbi:uncharacterized protein, partial [Salmo salar]|uniref:Uncharacterized protein n=1 Tax=Salmo salar TaxID=8030 RepID=A0ABM3E8S3_SALSA
MVGKLRVNVGSSVFILPFRNPQLRGENERVPLRLGSTAPGKPSVSPSVWDPQLRGKTSLSPSVWDPQLRGKRACPPPSGIHSSGGNEPVPLRLGSTAPGGNEPVPLRLGRNMMKFRFRRQGNDPQREKLKQELFAFNKTVEHGFPHQPSALTFDPQLQLMAIGTKSGAIKMYPLPRIHPPLFLLGAASPYSNPDSPGAASPYSNPDSSWVIQNPPGAASPYSNPDSSW